MGTSTAKTVKKPQSTANEFLTETSPKGLAQAESSEKEERHAGLLLRKDTCEHDPAYSHRLEKKRHSDFLATKEDALRCSDIRKNR